MPVRSKLVVSSIAMLLGGCAQLAELPDVAKLPQNVVGTADAQRKVSAMAEQAQQHQIQAAKEIEEAGKAPTAGAASRPY